MLILVLLGSGCTVPILNMEIPGIPDIPGFGGPTVVQYEHDIVVIKSLEAIPAELDAGQSTKIISYVENVGDKKVETVEVELYDYCSGLFQVDKNQSSCPKNKWADVPNSGRLVCNISLLPGQVAPVIWTLKQKNPGEIRLKTICPPDGVKVSVSYWYSTSSLTTVSFISQDELERSLEQRTQKSVESYIVAGQGPVKPYITVEDSQPIPVYKGARTSIALKVSNKGAGQLASRVDVDPKKPELGKEIAIGRDDFIGIFGLGASTGLVTENPCMFVPKTSTTSGAYIPTENVKLIGKDSYEMLCQLDLSGLDGKVIKTDTRHLEVWIKYQYMVTKSVQVTVNPKIVS